MQQITVRAVQLDKVEAQAISTFRSGDKGVADAGEAVFVECLRRRPALVEWDRRGADRLPRGVAGRQWAAALPRHLGRGLAAGMGELDAELGTAPAPAQRDDRGERRLVLVGIETETTRRDAPCRLDAGRFEDQQTRP